MNIFFNEKYTLEEINDLIAFYETSAGKKVLKENTLIPSAVILNLQMKLAPKLGDALWNIKLSCFKLYETKSLELMPVKKG